MTTVRLIVAKTSGPTGRTLEGLLRDLGVPVSQTGKGLVSYGVPLNTSQPCLNANAGVGSKVEQLRKLQKSDVLVPRFWVGENPAEFPVLARKSQHHGGTDIRVVLQPEEVPWRRAAGFSHFVKFLPIVREYRVWVYRRQHLATYSKDMAHPEEYKYNGGRNHRNGFAFNLVKSEAVPRGAVEMAVKAVSALDLDFGAVDILQSTDGRFYVLEVNTAPGVEGAARQGLRSLAQKIAKWAQNGYPNRRTESP